MTTIKNSTTYSEFADIEELKWQISEMEYHLKQFKNCLEMANDHINKCKQHAA